MEFLGIALVILAVIFYFLPAVISSQRNTLHGGAILAIYFFFGWTVLGWIAALIWAIVESPKQAKDRRASRSPVGRSASWKHGVWAHGLAGRGKEVVERAVL